jgi:uncharacterized membrane protein YfcA
VPLIPESLHFTEFWLLVGISFFTSFLTAAVGIGGGSILLALMAQVMPAGAIIPVHGVVQLGSNVGRAAVLYESVDRELLGWFVAGSLVGALIGGRIVVTMPVDALRLTLGAFILYSAWGPKLGALARSKKTLAMGGLLTTTLTMFVGATGPFVMSMLRAFPLKPVALVATMASCVAAQHLLKVLVFGLLGFAFGPYVPLMALMVGLGFLGTLAGRHVLLRVDPKKFTLVLNIVLTLLAVRLIGQALL